MDVKEFDKKYEEMKKQMEALQSQLEIMSTQRAEIVEQENKKKAARLEDLKNKKKECEAALEDIQKQRKQLEEQFNNQVSEYEIICKKIDEIENQFNFSKEESVESINKETRDESIKQLDKNNKLENSEMSSPFEEALKQVQKDVTEDYPIDNTNIVYRNRFSGLKVYDKELYIVVNELEEIAQTSYEKTFKKLYDVLNIFVNRILEKNKVVDDIKNDEDLYNKISYVVNVGLFSLPENVTYECVEGNDLKASPLMYLALVSKLAITEPECYLPFYPIIDSENMEKVLKSLSYVFNVFYK